MEHLVEQVRSHLRLTGKRAGDGREIAWCPFHGDGEGDPPHQPNFYLSERGYICHACGASGNLRNLRGRLGIVRSSAAAAAMMEMGATNGPNPASSQS